MNYIAMAVGVAVPIAAAAPVTIGLRHLFGIFVREGASLFADIDLPDSLVLSIGTLMAKINVAILLLAWIGLFLCDCFDVEIMITSSIGIAGLLAALLATILIGKWNLGFRGWLALRFGALAFAGGNLPLLLLIPVGLLFL